MHFLKSLFALFIYQVTALLNRPLLNLGLCELLYMIVLEK